MAFYVFHGTRNLSLLSKEATTNAERLNRSGAQALMRDSGSALVVAVWLLSSLLVLILSFRLFYSVRYRKSCLLPVSDDLVVATIGVIGLASILSTSATVTDATRPDDVPHKVGTSDVQIVSYASTILFVVALNLSKLPVVLWLKRLNLPSAFKVATIATGCAILTCTLAMAAAVIFQCQLPKPWDIQSGQCISSYLLWTVMIAIDITIDISLIFLPTVAVMSLDLRQCNESRAAFMLSLRTLLIIPALVRLVYLQQPTSEIHNLMLESQPYAIATLCQITIAVILSCTPALPCLATLTERPSCDALVAYKKKHWSDSSYTSDITDDCFTTTSTPVTKAPLPPIKGSRASSMHSHQSSVVSIASSIRKDKVPSRPPPPSEHQRPDMMSFTQKPTVLRPPPVTMLCADWEVQRSDGLSGWKYDLMEFGARPQHVDYKV